MVTASEFRQAAEIILRVSERLASIEISEHELSLISNAMGELQNPLWSQFEGVDWEQVRHTAGTLTGSMASVAESSAAMRKELEGVKTFLRSFGNILEERDRLEEESLGTVM